MRDITKLIDLVHKRDELIAERMRISHQIQAVENEIAGEGGIPQIAHMPLGYPDEGTYGDKAIAFLKANEGKIQFPRMATLLYGEDSKQNQNKARSVVYFLHRKKRIRKAGRGSYKVVDDAPLGRLKGAETE